MCKQLESRAGLIRWAITLAVAFSFLTATVLPSAFAADSKPAAGPLSPEDAAKRLEQISNGAYPYSPTRSFREGAYGLIDRHNQIVLAGGVLAIVGAHQLDPWMQEEFSHKHRIGDLEHLGNHYLGTGVPGTILGVGLWVFGDLADDSYSLHAGQALLESLLTAGLLTIVVKETVQRERPDRSDSISFPSGHTSTVMTAAVVLHEFYGWKLGVPGYLMAGITAVGRMSENRHWFSDTVAASTLGLLVGHAFAEAHLKRYRQFEAQDKTTLTVYPAPTDGGMQLMMRFTY